ncbi:annexin A1 [Salvelinus sp. IW2-2015]|uniref:annexin A1 n=1 Tax=Salvelinus sp. IW2-2015 TaxID=2691554 RepID=UPI000CDFEDC0|nr:annexin A1 [Salvelinus alpinus]
MSFIAAFFKQIFYLGQPDDSTLPSQGTVTPDPNFNVDGDVLILDKAIKAKGVDENTIIDVLVRRSNAQRQQIKATYENAKGKPLETAPDSRSPKGTLEDVVLWLCSDASPIETKCAIQPSSITVALLDMRDTMVNQNFADSGCTGVMEREERVNVCQEFKVGPRKDETALENAPSCRCCHLTVFLFCLSVKCAGSKPAFFAEKLNLAMKGKGTRTNILTRVMVSRSEVDLARIRQEYKKTFGKTLSQEILDDTNGDYEKILLALCGSDN